MSDEPEEIAIEGEAPAAIPGQEIVTVAKTPLSADDQGILPIIPRNTEEASRYAAALIRADMVPDAYRYTGKDVTRLFQRGQEVREGDPNAPLILAGILKSLEVGLPPQTGLGSILPLNGRFTIWGDGAVALVQRDRVITKQTARRIGPGFDPELEIGAWPIEYGWEVSYWRRHQDEPYVGRFTVRDAKRAGLWMNSKKQPWIQYPDRMLFNRARAFALRDGFADCLYGLGIREELLDAIKDEDGVYQVGTRHKSALDDEPETAAIEHQPEPTVDLGAEKVKAEPPADLLNRDF